ncbi:hypothetical protein E05_00240 [Plautia stali symbiont]|nr:hypothetical protein E05_00240 [Plautia stali symbiont]
MPDDAKSGGGLLVATIQLAITAGAAAGGWMFDLQGAGGVFLASGVLMLLAAIRRAATRFRVCRGAAFAAQACLTNHSNKSCLLFKSCFF